MSVCPHCSGLFVDTNNNLYCSQDSAHQVVRKSLQSASSPRVIVAGTGCAGSAMDMLSSPHGIFVTLNFDLYVADWGNNRIQRFRSGEINGTTMPTGAITLNYPTAVVLDADGHLFITEWSNSRIVGSGPYGFRCVVGCSGISGPASNQLNNPRTMSFDSDGNLFVLDRGNNRIQKFFLATNSCGCE